MTDYMVGAYQTKMTSTTVIMWRSIAQAEQAQRLHRISIPIPNPKVIRMRLKTYLEERARQECNVLFLTYKQAQAAIVVPSPTHEGIISFIVDAQLPAA